MGVIVELLQNFFIYGSVSTNEVYFNNINKYFLKYKTLIIKGLF